MEVLEKSESNIVYYGDNIESDLEKIFTDNEIKNTEVVLITGSKSFDESEYKNDFWNACNKLGIYISQRIKVAPNPASHSINKTIKNFKKGIPWLFCIGGGSVIDYGKLLKLRKYKKAKIFTLYTLPGSGSILTPFAIYDNDEFKIGDHSGDVVPNVVYINEKNINKISVPLKLSSICDIFAHAFESLISGISNDESRMYSKRSLEIILKYQLNFDLIQPRDLILADINAAKAESRAVVLFPHAIGHYLTYKFNIPHPIASIVYCKRYIELLTSKGVSIEGKYIKYLEILEESLNSYGLYPIIREINAQEALTLIRKYMSFSIKNAPATISLEEYINLVNY